MTPPPTRELVEHLVRSAFADVPRPQESEIALHDCDECAALRATFSDYTWTSLPSSVISRHAHDLSLLGPRGLIYYLPAYLLYALGHFSTSDAATEAAIFALTPSEDDENNDDRREFRYERLKPFGSSQIRAVEHFLLFVEADETWRVYLGDIGEGRRRLLRLWERRWDA